MFKMKISAEFEDDATKTLPRVVMTRKVFAASSGMNA